jgi:hypothetical protein
VNTYGMPNAGSNVGVIGGRKGPRVSADSTAICSRKRAARGRACQDGLPNPGPRSPTLLCRGRRYGFRFAFRRGAGGAL